MYIQMPYNPSAANATIVSIGGDLYVFDPRTGELIDSPNTGYDALIAARNALSGTDYAGKIDIVTDLTISQKVAIGSSTILNGNGHTLTNSHASDYIIEAVSDSIGSAITHMGKISDIRIICDGTNKGLCMTDCVQELFENIYIEESGLGIMIQNDSAWSEANYLRNIHVRRTTGKGIEVDSLNFGGRFDHIMLHTDTVGGINLDITGSFRMSRVSNAVMWADAAGACYNVKSIGNTAGLVFDRLHTHPYSSAIDFYLTSAASGGITLKNPMLQNIMKNESSYDIYQDCQNMITPGHYLFDDFLDGVEPIGSRNFVRYYDTTASKIRTNRPKWGVTTDGIDHAAGYVDIDNGELVQLAYEKVATSDEWTWEMKVQFPVVPTSSALCVLLMKGTDFQIDLLWDHDVGYYYLRHNQTGSWTTLKSGTHAYDTNIHTIKVTRNSSGVWELFYDGASDGTSAAMTYIPATPYFQIKNNTDQTCRVSEVSIY